MELRVAQLPLAKLKGIGSEGQGSGVGATPGTGKYPHVKLGNLLSDAIMFFGKYAIPIIYPNKYLIGNGGLSKFRVFHCDSNKFRENLFRAGLVEVWKGITNMPSLNVLDISPQSWRTLCVNYCFHDRKMNQSEMKKLAFTMMHTYEVQQNHYVVQIVADVADDIALSFDTS